MPDADKAFQIEMSQSSKHDLYTSGRGQVAGEARRGKLENLWRTPFGTIQLGTNRIQFDKFKLS